MTASTTDITGVCQAGRPAARPVAGALRLLPVHWGTFNLALHAWNEPAETLLALAAPRGVRVLTPGLGEAFEPARVEGPKAWWR